jgi:AraC-like DNA-binding protein/mannose-6-phosphate isomerase-like protein (cupin superfamily)
VKGIEELIGIIDEYPETILVVKQQTEQKLAAHKHDKGQLLLVFGGIAYLQTSERDYYIPSNHYVWIPKRYLHNLMFNTQDLFIINIYFPDNDETDTQFYNELGIYPVSRLLSEMLSFTESWQGNFSNETWEYEYLNTVKHLLPKENLNKFTIQLPTTDDKKLNEITNHLRDNLSEVLNMEDIASRFCISVRSLTRLFQNKLHISFLQYIKMLRIIRAMELLKGTGLSISEIAYEVGYSNISAFSNTFTQMTNMRPGEFRSML